MCSISNCLLFCFQCAKIRNIFHIMKSTPQFLQRIWGVFLPLNGIGGELILQRVGVGNGTPEVILVPVLYLCGSIAFIAVLEGITLVLPLPVVAVERDGHKVVVTDEYGGIDKAIGLYALGPHQPAEWVLLVVVAVGDGVYCVAVVVGPRDGRHQVAIVPPQGIGVRVGRKTPYIGDGEAVGIIRTPAVVESETIGHRAHGHLQTGQMPALIGKRADLVDAVFHLYDPAQRIIEIAYHKRLRCVVPTVAIHHRIKAAFFPMPTHIEEVLNGIVATLHPFNMLRTAHLLHFADRLIDSCKEITLANGLYGLILCATRHNDGYDCQYCKNAFVVHITVFLLSTTYKTQNTPKSYKKRG